VRDAFRALAGFSATIFDASSGVPSSGMGLVIRWRRGLALCGYSIFVVAIGRGNV